jgi:hypothetical protein
VLNKFKLCLLGFDLGFRVKGMGEYYLLTFSMKDTYKKQHTIFTYTPTSYYLQKL